MRKILSAILLGSLAAALVMPAAVMAQDAPQGCSIKTTFFVGGTECTQTTLCPFTEEKCGVCCLFNTINTVINWIFYILMAVVVLLIIVGGVTYMTAAGDPEKAGKGKKIIIYAIVGLAIALIARAVPSIVRVVMGL